MAITFNGCHEAKRRKLEWEKKRKRNRQRHIKMDDGTYQVWHGISKRGAQWGHMQTVCIKSLFLNVTIVINKSPQGMHRKCC